jgi:FkbM family methyltransferase
MRRKIVSPGAQGTPGFHRSVRIDPDDSKYAKRAGKQRKAKSFVGLCCVGLLCGALLAFIFLNLFVNFAEKKPEGAPSNKFSNTLRSSNRYIQSAGRRVQNVYTNVADQLSKSKSVQTAKANINKMEHNIKKAYNSMRHFSDGPAADEASDDTESDTLMEPAAVAAQAAAAEARVEKKKLAGKSSLDPTFKKRYDVGYGSILKDLERERKMRQQAEYKLAGMQEHSVNDENNNVINGVPQRHALLQRENKNEEKGNDIEPSKSQKLKSAALKSLKGKLRASFPEALDSKMDGPEDDSTPPRDEDDDEDEDEEDQNDPNSKGKTETEEDDLENEEDMEDAEILKGIPDGDKKNVPALPQDEGKPEMEDSSNNAIKKGNSKIDDANTPAEDDVPEAVPPPPSSDIPEKEDSSGSNSEGDTYNVISEGRAVHVHPPVYNVISEGHAVHRKGPSSGEAIASDEDNKPVASDEDSKPVASDEDSKPVASDEDSKVVASDEDTEELTPPRPDSSGSAEVSSAGEGVLPSGDGKVAVAVGSGDGDKIVPANPVPKHCRINYKNLLKRTSFSASQGQDRFVMKLLNKKKNGFFVEFGAGNGIFESTSLVFEQQMCWTGICIEPSEVVFADLVKNRPGCTRVQGAICGNKESRMYMDVIDENGQWTGLSGFKDSMTKYHLKFIDKKVKENGWATKSYPVDCHKLDDLIEKYHPENGVVDFLSIDVEGYEREVVDSINFRDRDYGVVQVETNVDNIRETHDKKAMDDVRAIRERFRLMGYIPRSSAAGVDDFFIHPEIVKAATNRRKGQRRTRRRRRHRAPHAGEGQGQLNGHGAPYRKPVNRYHRNAPPRRRGGRHQGGHGGRESEGRRASWDARNGW